MGNYTVVSDKKFTPAAPASDVTEVVAEFCSSPGAGAISDILTQSVLISSGDIRDKLMRVKVEVDRNPSPTECKRIFGVSVADRYRVTLEYAGKPEREVRNATLSGGVGAVRGRSVGATFLPAVPVQEEDLAAESGLELGPLQADASRPGGAVLPPPTPGPVTILDPRTFYSGPDITEDSEIGPVLAESTRVQNRTPDGAKVRADGADRIRPPQADRPIPQLPGFLSAETPSEASPEEVRSRGGQAVGAIVIGLVPVLAVLAAIAGLFFLLGILVYHIIRKGFTGATSALLGAAVIGIGIILLLRGRKQARAPTRSANPHRHRHTAACRQNP